MALCCYQLFLSIGATYVCAEAILQRINPGNEFLATRNPPCIPMKWIGVNFVTKYWREESSFTIWYLSDGIQEKLHSPQFIVASVDDNELIQQATGKDMCMVQICISKTQTAIYEFKGSCQCQLDPHACVVFGAECNINGHCAGTRGWISASLCSDGPISSAG